MSIFLDAGRYLKLIEFKKKGLFLCKNSIRTLILIKPSSWKEGMYQILRYQEYLHHPAAMKVKIKITWWKTVANIWVKKTSL